MQHSHRGSPRPPLAPWVLTVYNEVEALVDSHPDQTGIPREDVFEHLTTLHDDTLTQTEVDHALEQLLNRGYLYAVENDLRVTERD